MDSTTNLLSIPTENEALQTELRDKLVMQLEIIMLGARQCAGDLPDAGKTA
jgi:hypothetical protein